MEYKGAQLSKTLHLFCTWYIAMIVLTCGTLTEDLCLYLHVREANDASFTTHCVAANNAKFCGAIFAVLGMSQDMCNTVSSQLAQLSRNSVYPLCILFSCNSWNVTGAVIFQYSPQQLRLNLERRHRASVKF